MAMDKNKRIQPQKRKNLSKDEKKTLRKDLMGNKPEPKEAAKPAHEPIVTSDEEIERQKRSRLI